MHDVSSFTQIFESEIMKTHEHYSDYSKTHAKYKRCIVIVHIATLHGSVRSFMKTPFAQSIS